MTIYRNGGKQRRNIYRVTDAHPEGIYIGVFFDEVDAVIAVEALNMARTVHVARGWCAPSEVTESSS